MTAALESRRRAQKLRLRACARRAVNLRLGEILVESGDISQSQLRAALDAKRASGRRIGEELIAAGHLRAERLSAALRLQRRLAIFAFAAALIPMTRESHAEQARAQMAVTATVVDTVGVRAVYQAQRLDISPDDVRRGYVDVAAASRFDVRCASLCVFEFRPTAGLVKTVRVTGLDNGAEFGAAGASVVHKPAPRMASQVAIDYRITLAPGVEPGIYQWPLALTVLPM